MVLCCLLELIEEGVVEIHDFELDGERGEGM